MYKLGFIGMGNMSSAIQTGFMNAQYINPEDICGFDLSKEAQDRARERGISVCDDVNEVISQSSIIVIGVKPQVVENVISPIKNALKNKTIISMVLGYDFDRYEKLLDSTTKHLTFMPNTPIAVGEGMTLFEEKHNLNDEDYLYVKKAFESSGSVQVLPSHLMGVGGALSGCGPAYIYMVIEALADGAVYYGLPRDAAYKLASQTVLGSGKMQLESNIHPGILKDNVTSPAGSTIRGVKALEEGQIRSDFMNAIDQSMKR